MRCPVMQVKPWGEGQGDFVEINVEDFSPDVHEAFDAADKPADPNAALKQRIEELSAAPAKALTVPELKAALAAKGIEIPDGAKKADLQALLDAADKPAE